jgi:glucosylceramidase
VTPGVDDVAFRNPDGSIVLVAYNNGTTASRFGVAWKGRALTYTLPAGAMVTLEFNRP